jgi:hypothetical protein
MPKRTEQKNRRDNLYSLLCAQWYMDSEAEKIASDFQCYVCGAVFTTEQDRRQHLEKELAGKARDESSSQDIQTAKEQTELSETYRQSYESV